jgi:DNA alkylation damage repair protein AlkB
LLHRDLQNPSHKTNVDFHYHVPAHSLPNSASRDLECSPLSFFSQEQDSVILPKDPTVHKPITIRQMLENKLRWVTLGGQYDWTNKVYPYEVPPAFPSDIADLMKGLFPDVNPEAAIVNFYSPGDTLSVHRDVSEDCANSLISVSIGCDALFIAGNDDGSRTSTIRLKSGDVLLMSGESRYAWHAVPKIIPGTCPSWLEEWPAVSGASQYQNWRGWMSNKRINLNVRQMASSDVFAVRQL